MGSSGRLFVEIDSNRDAQNKKELYGLIYIYSQPAKLLGKEFVLLM